MEPVTQASFYAIDEDVDHTAHLSDVERFRSQDHQRSLRSETFVTAHVTGKGAEGEEFGI